MKVMIVVGALETFPMSWKENLRNWKSVEEPRSYKLQHYKDWLENSEKSWKPEETYFHSDSAERPLVKIGVEKKTR